MSSNKWENWIINGGGMPTLSLPEVPEPTTGDHVHVYEYIMDEDEDGGVLDDDVCKICGKSWTELERI